MSDHGFIGWFPPRHLPLYLPQRRKDRKGLPVKLSPKHKNHLDMSLCTSWLCGRYYST